MKLKVEIDSGHVYNYIEKRCTMKKLRLLILSTFLVLLLGLLTGTSQNVIADSHSQLDSLKHTENFSSRGLEHIFLGEINKRGDVVGYHYEGFETEAQVIESTRSKTDNNGIYRAKITLDGKEKKAFSTFFPKDWEPKKVIKAINEAYKNREQIHDNLYEGVYTEGVFKKKRITIQMYLDKNDKIITAFPLYKR